MGYLGRISIVLIYIIIVIGWHSLYFVTNYNSAIIFMIEQGQYKWDLFLILLFSPLFWWLGKQYDSAKFLSEKDALTGLYNRRFISEIAPRLLAKMDKRTETLTISILDCNNFKQINDQYGHKLGDLVLKNVSLILLTSLGKKDIAARWGGDEFLIISPYSDLQKINEITEKIEKRFSNLSKELEVNVAVSIGTAVYPYEGCDMEELLAIADRNMYKCKARMKKADYH